MDLRYVQHICWRYVSHLDVSLDAPICAPAVLHQPVVFDCSCLYAPVPVKQKNVRERWQIVDFPPNGQNSVVKELAATVVVVVHSWLLYCVWVRNGFWMAPMAYLHLHLYLRICICIYYISWFNRDQYLLRKAGMCIGWHRWRHSQVPLLPRPDV